MTIVQELYEKTLSLRDLIGTYTDQNRDQTIEQVQQLLNKRDELIANLPREYTEEEKRLGSFIVSTNSTINSGLELILKDIKEDHLIIKKKKQTSNRYRNPYRGMSRDGMFLDKKE